MLLIVSFWSAILMVTGKNMSYTTESFTVDNKTCMTDCVNFTCFTGEKDNAVRCTPGDKPALTYYTTQQRSQKKWCLSRCGRFDEKGYDWCYVSENEWDHCNPERGSKIIINRAFTFTKGPCFHECEDGTFVYDKWCFHYFGSWEGCNTKVYSWVQSKTIYGKDCVGYCGKFNEAYNWCIDTREQKDSCAPPGRDFSLFSKMFRKCMIARNCRTCNITEEPRWNTRMCKNDACNKILESGYVEKYAKILEHQGNYLIVQNVNENNNPIYKYTVMPKVSSEDPTLPLLLRAKITNKTLGPPGDSNDEVKQNLQRMGMIADRKDGNNDEEGNLIGYTLGGANEMYNYAPQTTAINDGKTQWDGSEWIIRNFIKKTGGFAKMTVVVLYHDLPRTTRPDGFAVNIALYHSNNTLHEECNDRYYSNDPDALNT